MHPQFQWEKNNHDNVVIDWLIGWLIDCHGIKARKGLQHALAAGDCVIGHPTKNIQTSTIGPWKPTISHMKNHEKNIVQQET